MNRVLIATYSDNIEKELTTLFYQTNVFDSTKIIILSDSHKTVNLPYENVQFLLLENLQNLSNYSLCEALKNEVKNDDYIFFASSEKNNEIANILALKLGSKALINALKIKKEQDNKLILSKNIYSNYLVADYKISNNIVCTMLLDNKFYKKVDNTNNVAQTAYKQVNIIDKVPFVVIDKQVKQQNDLENAQKVVLVGKGVKKENVEKCKQLATLIGGEIGATRPVTYDGQIEIDRMVGSSNISVNPKLLLAIGVSGSAPLVQGIKNSEKIVAINKDKSAMIFSHSDIGIVCDSNDFLDKMISVLEENND